MKRGSSPSRCARPAEGRSRERGFSLPELLVGACISLSAAAGAAAVVGALQLRFSTDSEWTDVVQRVRAAVDSMERDLSRAGLGPYQGASAGALGLPVAAVFPFRQGASSPDPPGLFRSDAVTVLYVSDRTAAQASLAQPLAARSGAAVVVPGPGCPVGSASCGFAAGMDVVVFDDTGAYDMFRVQGVTGASLDLRHTMPDTGQIYPAGARIAEAASHTYFLKSDPPSDTFQLVHYDGVASEAPVADHIVGLAFEYFGDPEPPVVIAPLDDPRGSWTTYGPRPPPRTTQPTAYPSGENCAFRLDAVGAPVPRLDRLGSGGSTLVPLGAAELTDGPWCPDGSNPHRYDADLLRVRRIGVTLRAESALSALRGPAGVLFTRGGTSRAAGRWVPDQEIRFDVSPANLNRGR